MIAVYPGSFDPITYGHLDIIERALPLFDRLIVAVAEDVEKQPLFTVDERVEILEEVLGNNSKIKVGRFKGLLVHYAREEGAKFIIRGLRAVSDFESELQMALINKQLSPEIETLFLMTKESHLYLSSSLAKEIVKLGGEVESLVPRLVETRLREKFRTRGSS
jgi:pantetheine-phosphate adenylyltransferase